jgi:hypothetical protein
MCEREVVSQDLVVRVCCAVYAMDEEKVLRSGKSVTKGRRS